MPAPINSVAPAISGAALDGQTLIATNGAWTNNPSNFTYQWNRGGTPISGATSFTYSKVTADNGLLLTVSVIASNGSGSSAAATSSPTSASGAVTAGFPGQGFPGQVGVPVGFAAAPGYTGSLTPSSGPFVSGTVSAPRVYSFLDIDSGTSGLYLDNTKAYITFIGCRFQSNNTQGANIDCAGATNMIFSYCSIVPRTVLVTVPPSADWPSAGAAQGVIEQPTAYQISADACYQYGFNLATAGVGGPFTIDHCDIWGGQNLITLYGTSTTIIINDNWIHDFADSLNTPHVIGGTPYYHQDGPGYLNSGVGPSNVTINHNTIGGICNSNIIAFQGSTSGSNNLTITNNFFGGGGSYMVVLTSTTNITFTDNFFATDIPWQYGPLYADYTTKFHTAGNTWARNKLKVRASTSPYAGSTLAWTGADDGKFMFPNSTVSVTDFV